MPEGTGFPAISGILVFALVSTLEVRPSESSVIAMVLCLVRRGFLIREAGFSLAPLLLLFFLGTIRGIHAPLKVSHLREEPGRVFVCLDTNSRCTGNSEGTQIGP